MDKRELKIDYFVCRNSVPAGYEELSEKILNSILHPKSKFIDIPLSATAHI